MNKLKNMSIAGKFYAVMGGALALFAIFSLINLVQLFGIGGELADIEASATDPAIIESIHTAAVHEQWVVYTTIIGLVISLAFGFWAVRTVANQISSNLDETVGFANKLADGDFSASISIDSEDETGVLSEVLEEMKGKIQESNEVINQTLEQSINGVVSIDENNNVTFFNKAAESLWGYKREEVIGKNVKMLVPMEFQAGHDGFVDANRQTGQDKIVGTAREVPLFTKTNEKKIANLSLSKVDVGGKIRYTAFLQDVTAQVKQREEVERLSLVANETDNSVIITDANGLVEYTNPGFTRLTGYSAEYMIGKKPGEVLQGQHTDEKTKQHIREKIKAKEPFYDEILNYDSNGNPYWISLAINPVTNEKGELHKFISIQANVTSTKQSSMEFGYKLAAIDRSNTVLEIDLSGTIIAANDNMVAALGYSAQEELVGRKFESICESGYMQSSEYKAINQAVESGDFKSGEFKFMGKRGNTVWISGSYNPIMNYDGKVSHIVQYGQDITDKKEAIEEISRNLAALADGDLKARVQGDFDEEFSQLKNTFNSSVERLQMTVVNLYNVAQEVTSASAEVADGAANTSARAESAASTLEETAASVEELTQTAQQNAKSVHEVKQMAVKTQEAANMGQSVVQTTVEAMQNISDASRRISDIIGVMDEIAFQTNLLALNASVEAARAGEAGRGFAVVAGEVRNLAQRSATSAKEISDLIKDSGVKVGEGTDLVDRSGESFAAITDLIAEVTNQVTEIADSTQQQLSGIRQINESVINLDRMTQQNSEVVEKTSSASSGMNAQVNRMKNDLAFFKI